jgi:hypothetical protein
MGQDRSEITEQVVKFPPKQQSSSPADQAGQAVIAQIQKAAQLAAAPTCASRCHGSRGSSLKLTSEQIAALTSFSPKSSGRQVA